MNIDDKDRRIMALTLELAELKKEKYKHEHCSACGIHEVSLIMICHNSDCKEYAQEVTLHEGWYDVQQET